jgi:hypothetical protein
MNEFIDLTIHTKQGKSITLQLGSIGVINKSTKEKFSDAYAFIVSNIIERQLNEFSESLRCREKADFGSFEISSEAFYRKKLFGGYDIIPLSKLLRCHIENGEFFVLYHDGENKCKRKKCGFVYEIINLHVVQAFMSAIERQKTSAWVLYKQRYTSSDGS